jgi:glycosyltransferase involved in cell wall biosynthesis
MRVIVDARIAAGRGGGVETLIKGLAKGFSEILDLNYELIFVVNPGNPLLLGENNKNNSIKIIESSYSKKSSKMIRRMRGILRLLNFHLNVPIPDSLILNRDQVLELLNPQVIHYPYQATSLVKFPTVYHPHDLQHKYFPKNFSILARLFRDANYSIMCRKSKAVIVSSNWVKRDIEFYYKVPSKKIHVIPLLSLGNSLTLENEQKTESIKSLEDSPTFLFYPAANWPHKNHINLLKAIQLLNHQGVNIRLVCTGMVHNRFKSPMLMARELGIHKNVFVLGHVSATLVDILYNSAWAVIVPTKFEAASFPIYEAQARGKAVACSNVTSLPEQVKDSALLFDPEDISEIASVIKRLWFEKNLKADLEFRSLKNIDGNTWVNVCKSLDSIYKQIVGHSEEASKCKSLGK